MIDSFQVLREGTETSSRIARGPLPYARVALPGPAAAEGVADRAVLVKVCPARTLRWTAAARDRCFAAPLLCSIRIWKYHEASCSVSKRPVFHK